MTILNIILLVTLVLYLIIAFALAKFIAILLFTPPTKFRPTKEMVINNVVKEFASNQYVYSKANFDEFDKWKKEIFICENGNIKIPTEFHPIDNAKGCVILAHGFGQNRYAAVPYAEIFRKLGYSTLVFDQRCFGESTARNGSFGELEATDVITLIKWVKNKMGKETKIILHGVSMGSITSLNALQYTNDIDGVIADCGPSRGYRGAKVVSYSLIPLPNPYLMPFIIRRANSLGVHLKDNNPIDSLSHSNVPVLIIHGDADKSVPISDAIEMKEVFKNPKSRLEIFPGRGHAYSICDRTRYEEIVEDFLKAI